MLAKWSNEEDEILRKYYPKYGYKKCQKYLDRTQKSISARAWFLDIKSENYLITPNIFETIKKMMLIDNKNVTEIANELGICRHTIYQYFKRRELKITNFYTSERQFHKLPKKNQGIMYVYKSYKNAAKKRNIKFDLTVDQLKDITSSNCMYCNSNPSMRSPQKLYIYFYNGIDRKDNNLGYTIENSVACCNFCNFMKSSHSEEEFLNQIEKIYKFRIVK